MDLTLEDVQQVIDICPNVDRDDVWLDLNLTKNVALTINRCLDGQYLKRNDKLGVDGRNCNNSEKVYNGKKCNIGKMSPSIDIKEDNLNTSSELENNEDVKSPCISFLSKPASSAGISSEKHHISAADLGNLFDSFLDDFGVTDAVKSLTPSTSIQSNKEFQTMNISHSNGNYDISISDDDDTRQPSKLSGRTLPLSPGFKYSRETVVIDLDENSNSALPTLQHKLKQHRNKNNSDVINLDDIESYPDENVFKHKLFDQIDGEPLQKKSSKTCLSEHFDAFDSDDNQSFYSSYKSKETSSQFSSTSSSISSRIGSELSSQTSSVSIGDGKAKRTKKTSEQLEQGKLKKQKQQEERDKKKMENIRKRAEKEKEKQGKNFEKAKENALKKAAQDANKNAKPGECTKFIVVIIDKMLLDDSSLAPAILGTLEGSSIRCKVKDLSIPNSVMWMREIPATEVGHDGQVKNSLTEVEEDDTLIYVAVDVFVDLIYNSKKNTSSGRNLYQFFHQMQQTLERKKLTLLVKGMESYFRSIKLVTKRQFKEAVSGTNAPRKQHDKITNNISRLDLEEALVELQMTTSCNIQLVESNESVARVILQYTKAVAEITYKQSRLNSIFSFMPEGGGSVRVDRDGKGLLKVWKHQIQQFRNVSPDMASAIIAQYQSPYILLQAYKRCSSKKEAELLLQNITVRRGAGVLETNRRIGKELSRRIYQHMMIDEPDFLLQ